MPLELDKEKLLEHLRTEWKKRWDARLSRPRELCEEFYGPIEPEAAHLRDMHRLYFDSYVEGAQDMLEVVLELDSDIRGAEAMASLMNQLKIDA